MTREFPESDWKLFRQLHPLALDRFCARVLSEMSSLATDAGRTNHQLYDRVGFDDTTGPGVGRCVQWSSTINSVPATGVLLLARTGDG